MSASGMERLRERVRTKSPRISVERARLYTESTKRTEGEPQIIRQDKALRHIPENIPTQIFPGELVVCAMASDPPFSREYLDLSLSRLCEIGA